MEILVTGAAGRIGRNLVEELRQEHDVVAACLQPEKLDGLDRVTPVCADMRYPSHLQNIFNDRHIDGVVHLAAIGNGASEVNPDLASAVNVAGTYHLGRLAAEAGVGIFVNYSTSAVYNQRVLEPTAEDQNVRPTSVYAATKLKGEELLSGLAGFFAETRFISLRLFNVVGLTMDLALPHRMMAGQHVKLFDIYGRDYVLDEDVIDVTGAALALPPESGYEAVNIGTGECTDNLRLINILRSWGIEPSFELVPYDGCIPPYTLADNSRAKSLFSYVPTPAFKSAEKVGPIARAAS